MPPERVAESLLSPAEVDAADDFSGPVERPHLFLEKTGREHRAISRDELARGDAEEAEAL